MTVGTGTRSDSDVSRRSGYHPHSAPPFRRNPDGGAAEPPDPTKERKRVVGDVQRRFALDAGARPLVPYGERRAGTRFHPSNSTSSSPATLSSLQGSHIHASLLFTALMNALLEVVRDIGWGRVRRSAPTIITSRYTKGATQANDHHQHDGCYHRH